jgi:hypothetical protein
MDNNKMMTCGVEYVCIWSPKKMICQFEYVSVVHDISCKSVKLTQLTWPIGDAKKESLDLLAEVQV